MRNKMWKTGEICTKNAKKTRKICASSAKFFP